MSEPNLGSAIAAALVGFCVGAGLATMFPLPQEPVVVTKEVEPKGTVCLVIVPDPREKWRLPHDLSGRIPEYPEWQTSR